MECKYFISASGCSRGDSCSFVHRICSFYTLGNCRQGDQCKYSHKSTQPVIHSRAVSEMVVAVSSAMYDTNASSVSFSKSTKSTSSELCAYFANGRCTKGNACHFMHSHDGSISTGTGVDYTDQAENRRVCSFFLQGRCSKGNACIFLHEEGIITKKVEEEEEVETTQVCRFFLRGGCTRFDCAYLHPEETYESDEQEVPSRIEALQSNERAVLGITRCAFADGAEVVRVITQPKSLLFQTDSMPRVSEERIRTALASYGQLLWFEYKASLIASGPKAELVSTSFVRASYESLAITLTAMESLKETPFAIHFVADAIKRRSKGEAVQARMMRVQWYGTSTSVAYAHFNKKDMAQKAARLCNGSILRKCRLICDFQEPSLRQMTSFTVVIKFTGAVLSTQDFSSLFHYHKLLGFSSVDIKQSCIADSSKAVRALLTKHGGVIESFKIKTQQNSDGKRKALVKFVDTQSISNATRTFSDTKHWPELNNSPLLVSPYYSCKFSVLRGVWTVIGDEFSSLQAALESDITSAVKCRFFPNKNEVSVMLTSSNAGELTTIRSIVESMLKGIVLLGEALEGNIATPLWHETFAGLSSALMRSFTAAANQPVFLLKDDTKRQVRYFGKPADFDLCIRAVNEYINLMSAMKHTIPLKDSNAFNALLRKNCLDELQQHCGALSRPIIDFSSRTLIIEGNNAVEQRAVSFILHLCSIVVRKAHHSIYDNKSQLSFCPVCMCEVEDNPKALNCGHSYCRECFEQYLAQAHSRHDATFPICCLADGCHTPIALYELEAAMDIEQTARMFQAALKCYVQKILTNVTFALRQTAIKYTPGRGLLILQRNVLLALFQYALLAK